MDNYMKGNPYFSDFLDSVEWTKQVQNYERNEKKNSGYEIKSKHDYRDKMEEVKEYAKYLDTMSEPNSNYKMHFIQEQEEA